MKRKSAGAITYSCEWRRCGKASCRCCRDGKGHGPYYYAHWRDERGKRCRRYLGRMSPPTAETQRADDASTVVTRMTNQTPTLRIRLFGGFEIECGNVALTGQKFLRPSARRLLALLCLHPAGLTPDEAVEALWPNCHPTAGRTALRTALATLRRVIEPAIAQRGIRTMGIQRLPPYQRRLRLHLLPGDWVDVHEFSTGDPKRLPLAALERLVDLYRGELLPEYRYEDWAAVAREALRMRWHALSLHLAMRLTNEGQPLAAIRRLEAVLADDGTQEEAARLLMQILVDQGRRDEALRVYTRLVRALHTELGLPPDALSQALAKRLSRERTGALAPTRSPRGMVEHLKMEIDRLRAQTDSPDTARRLARLWAERALLLDRLGEPELALGNVESGRLVLDALDFPAERSQLLLAEALIHYHQGRAHDAWRTANEAAQLAAMVGERGLAAWALRLQAQAAQEQGRLDEAIELARSSAAHFDSIGADEEAMRSRRVTAFCLWCAGRFPEAVTLYRYLLVEGRALGQAEHLAYILCGLGSSLYMLGELDAAESYLQEALMLATRLEDRYLILSVEYHVATVWAERATLAMFAGRREEQVQARREAISRFERVIALAQAQESQHMIVFAAVDLAVILAREGETEQAGALLVLAQRVLADLPENTAAQGWLRLGEAELALTMGDAEGAARQATAALPLLERASPGGLAQAHRVLAMALVAQSKTDAATPQWRASLAAAARTGQRIEEMRTRRAMEAC
jgi:DNA-binding SARP family transcriptional activator